MNIFKHTEDSEYFFEKFGMPFDEVSEREVSPLGHSIVVVVFGGELDRYILQDIHVRDDLVTETLDRVKPSASLTVTTMQSPRDVILHAEPFDRLEGALSTRTDPLARIAEELALEVALTLALT